MINHLSYADDRCRSVTVSGVVTDGVTLGHPCCNVDDCKEPLAKVTDEYCHLHIDNGSRCCVKGCVMPREPKFRTCVIREHREEESRRKTLGRRSNEHGKRGNNERGKRKGVKGAFSRRWTHNEQLLVRPCGVVIGRATFYQWESMTAVKVRSHMASTLDELTWYAHSADVHKKHIPSEPPGSGA